MPNQVNRSVDDNGETQISFSGCDIIASATINGKVYTLFTLETISVSTYRDTAPVRVLGQDAPVRYKQGTRTVSGTMVVSKVYSSNMQKMVNENQHFAIGDIKGKQAPDRLPPFNISIQVGTEYSDQGQNADLLGVVLMSSGLTLSVHDIYTEQTFGYVAREFIDLHDGISTEIGVNTGREQMETLSSIYGSVMSELKTQGMIDG